MAPIKLIFFFLILCSKIVFSQTIELGIPYCENITPTEIGYAGANYSIAQSTDGTMYFGNFNGIISYNGAHWHQTPVSGRPLLYQDNVGRIYVGGFNTIAELNKDVHNRMQIVSLVDSTYEFGQVQKIIYYANQIYFTANKSLYYIANRQIKRIISDEKPISIFTDRNTLFISTSDGISEFSNNKLVTSYIGEYFKGQKIIDMFRFANALIIRTESGFFKMVSKTSVEPFITDIDDDILRYGYSCVQRLSNNTLCVGTKRNGIYFINERGTLLNYLSSESGLYDNAIQSLFVDRANNVWAGFSNGLCRIETPSAFTYFNRNQRLPGKINALVRFNNYMYIGTETGVYKLIKGESKIQDFQSLFNEYTHCNVLVPYQQSLLAGTNQGLFEISASNTISKLLDGNIVSMKEKKSLLWIASKTHVYVANKTNKGLQLLQTIGPFDSNVTSLAIESDSILWIGTLYEGVYKIIKNNESYNVENYINSHGLPKTSYWIDVFETSSGILFSTDQGLYRFDPSISIFYKDLKISIPTEYIYARVSPLVEDTDKNIWVAFKMKGVYENQIAVAWNNNTDRYTLIANQFNKLSHFYTSIIFPDKNSVVWFGGFDGLVRMDFKQLFIKKNIETTRINQITLGKDSIYVFKHHAKHTPKHEFSYKYNNIRFDFSTPIYENAEKVVHVCMLEGLMNEWTVPSSSTHKEFLNLPAGNYVFRVKAYDIYGNESAETSFEFSISRHPLTSNWAIFLYIVLFLAMLTLFTRWRSYLFLKEKTKLSKLIRKRTEELLLEKEKSENILRNILPEHTARELKEKGRATSMRFEMATILFSDIQGFTKIAEEMAPDTLIDELDKYFLEFDKIVEKHNIEKIKTIGDAYMCAGGIPEKNKTNPIEVVVAALEMQYKIRLMQQEHEILNQNYWGLRIGIHTGPVIAGVVGSKKYSYDIWGDSVNTASRMESSGEVGKVNISENTYILVQEFFDCEYRGKMPVKYKGEIDMYFVNGFKAIFTEDPLRIMPNKFFQYKFALLKFEDLQEKMFERYETELPANLYYHNLKHMIDVTVQIEIIGKEEGVSDEEMLLLKTAALFHDSGFLIGYNEHEELSVQIVKNMLPNYAFNHEQIQIICELIEVTKLPHKPKNKLQEIMCDADLDYLGRNDYLAVSRDLYKELIEHNIIKKSEYEWNVMQIKFLQNHRFFTNCSKNRRNANKNKQIQYLQEQTKSFKI